ncbi:conserved hypothetical protein [Ricinus communis]|uniref:Secreted protein n=1 Tax=Ricinus communis TaxID=3988 RepID=B9R9R6_RICCO|nr:conserved hypothetical protein [Ricinus communis]
MLCGPRLFSFLFFFFSLSLSLSLPRLNMGEQIGQKVRRGDESRIEITVNSEEASKECANSVNGRSRLIAAREVSQGRDSGGTRAPREKNE